MAKPLSKAEHLDRLRELFVDAGTMVIVMQDYPDPDALAAAAGLRELANRLAGISCTLSHGGGVDRAENRALVRYLGLHLRPLTSIDLGRSDLVAMVDTQPGTGNNPLQAGVIPDVVIDHHPIGKATRSARFTDVRSRYGATSTIVFEYLQAAGIAPETPLATSLLYGIKSDTQDLGRDTSQADIDAFLGLYPLANKRMLSRIEHAPLLRDYFRMLSTALDRAVLVANGVLCGIGGTESPDMIAEIADLLLRNESSTWSLCHGVHAGRLLLSLRTCEPGASAGEAMRQIVGTMGRGGGHDMMAGGQIPLGRRSEKQIAEIENTVRKRFIRAIGARNPVAERLVERSNGDSDEERAT